jgi:hypothetical protein
MDGSPSSVLTFGLGSWGSTGLVVTLGMGVGEANPATLVGQWSNVIPCQSVNARIEAQSVNARIEAQSSNRRIET